MKVFLINIPTENACKSYQLCYDVIYDYFKRIGVEVFLLEKNDFGVEPSWLKLKCFDYVDDDFVLCWDMDLLPRRWCPSILNDLDFTKINVVRDSIFYTKTVKPLPEAPYYRYNCGLLGIPKSYRPMLDKVFLEAKTSKLPSYEQYPLNLEWSKNDFKDVHELDKTWNCIYHLPGENSFIMSAKAVHYTGPICSGLREPLVKVHRRLYFS